MSSKPKRAGKAVQAATDGLPKSFRFLCERCGNKYARPLEASGICYECDLKERKRLILREERQAASGVSRRHMKLRDWDSCMGSAAYLRAARAVRAFATEGDTIMGLIGKRGTGKTQMGAVAVWQCIESGSAARIISAVDLLSDLKCRYDMEGNAVKDWIYVWTRQRLLVIDEITVKIDSEHDRAMLTHICDKRYQDCKPTLLIGNIAPSSFTTVVGLSIASRCSEEGGLVHCNWDSFRNIKRKQA